MIKTAVVTYRHESSECSDIYEPDNRDIRTIRGYRQYPRRGKLVLDAISCLEQSDGLEGEYPLIDWQRARESARQQYHIRVTTDDIDTVYVMLTPRKRA